MNSQNQDGVYPISVNNETIQVYCDISKGGWTRVMNRINYASDFYKNWTEYKAGFGDVKRDHWLGFDSILKIMSNGEFIARFEFETVDAKDFFELDSFKISNESEKYKWKLGKLANRSIDVATVYHDENKFSTWDNINDPGNKDCPRWFQAGWWFNNCHVFCSTCEKYLEIGQLSDTRTKKWKTYNKFRILIKNKLIN